MRVTGTCTETDPAERFALDSRMRDTVKATPVRAHVAVARLRLLRYLLFYALSKVILGMKGSPGLVTMLAPSSNKCPTHRWYRFSLRGLGRLTVVVAAVSIISVAHCFFLNT